MIRALDYPWYYTYEYTRRRRKMSEKSFYRFLLKARKRTHYVKSSFEDLPTILAKRIETRKLVDSAVFLTSLSIEIKHKSKFPLANGTALSIAPRGRHDTRP